jgi:hypothetical protein
MPGAITTATSSPSSLFWARVEALAPGIDTLRLPPEVAHAWKEQLRTIKRSSTNAAGERVEVSIPRLNAKDELIRVRALYLDIAHWAVEDPARWGPRGRALSDQRRRGPEGQGT